MKSRDKILSATESASKPRKKAKKAKGPLKPPLRKLGSYNGTSRKSFTVPAPAGNYATEVLDFTDRNVTGGVFMSISDLSLFIESLPATAAIELDLLRGGGNPATPGDWNLAVKSYSTLGLVDMLPLAAWYGVRYRAKSGGTGGTAIINVGWD